MDEYAGLMRRGLVMWRRTVCLIVQVCSHPPSPPLTCMFTFTLTASRSLSPSLSPLMSSWLCSMYMLVLNAHVLIATLTFTFTLTPL